MSAFIRQFRFSLALVTSPLVAAEVQTAVANPSVRHESLEQAKALLAVHSVVLPTDLVNPFNPAGPASPSTTATSPVVDTKAAKPGGPKTDRDLLQTIASGLKPSGFFVLGGAPTLVFGQKRVKAGGNVTITFEGTEYTLEITSIELPNFTLRLNREEFTRPIK
jgi:hypothetical protein